MKFLIPLLLALSCPLAAAQSPEDDADDSGSQASEAEAERSFGRRNKKSERRMRVEKETAAWVEKIKAEEAERQRK